MPAAARELVIYTGEQWAANTKSYVTAPGPQCREEYRDRSRQAITFLVNGLNAYCEIPDNQLTFLRWNGLPDEQSQYEEAGPGRGSYVPGAAVLDEQGYWRIGVSITLVAPANISFVLYVSEQDGRPVAKVGSIGKTHIVELQVEGNKELYEEIVSKAKQAFGDPTKPAPKVFGFAP